MKFLKDTVRQQEYYRIFTIFHKLIDSQKTDKKFWTIKYVLKG